MKPNEALIGRSIVGAPIRACASITPPVAMAIPEKAWQAKVIETAKWYGWAVYHTHDSRRSEAGFPDLVLVRDTRLLFVELKSLRGRVSPAQREWLTRLEPCAEVHVWRPDDWQLVIERLAR